MPSGCPPGPLCVCVCVGGCSLNRLSEGGTSALKLTANALIYHQLADFRDALTRIYGVVPKIQCLVPEQVRLVFYILLSYGKDGFTLLIALSPLEFLGQLRFAGFPCIYVYRQVYEKAQRCFEATHVFLRFLPWGDINICFSS